MLRIARTQMAVPCPLSASPRGPKESRFQVFRWLGIDRTVGRAMTEFLLEVYLPAADARALEKASAVARAGAEHLAAEGCRVAFLHAIYVPEDETCFYVYEADSAEAVREAARQAEMTDVRVVAAVTPPRGVDHS